MVPYWKILIIMGGTHHGLIVYIKLVVMEVFWWRSLWTSWCDCDYRYYQGLGTCHMMLWGHRFSRQGRPKRIWLVQQRLQLQVSQCAMLRVAIIANNVSHFGILAMLSLAPVVAESNRWTGKPFSLIMILIYDIHVSIPFNFHGYRPQRFKLDLAEHEEEA